MLVMSLGQVFIIIKTITWISKVLYLFSTPWIVFPSSIRFLCFVFSIKSSWQRTRAFFSTEPDSSSTHVKTVCCVPLSGHTLEHGFDHSDSRVSLRPNGAHTHTQKFPQETAITRSGTLTTALLSLASVSSDAGEDEMQEEGCLNLDTTRVP